MSFRLRNSEIWPTIAFWLKIQMQIFQLQNQPSNFIVFIFRIVTPAQQERRRTTEQNLQIAAQVFGLPPQTIRPHSEESKEKKMMKKNDMKICLLFNKWNQEMKEKKKKNGNTGRGSGEREETAGVG